MVWRDKKPIRAALNKIAVSDRSDIKRSDTILVLVAIGVVSKRLEQQDISDRISEGGFCATLFRTARKSLILNGEMSEWSIEHAWKLTPLARADAHQIPPTHFRSTTSRNNDLRQRVPVNDGVAPGFRGVCDTVLTQSERRFTRTNMNEHRVAREHIDDRLYHLRGRSASASSHASVLRWA